MLIKRRSIKRRVSKHAFETKFKALGFTVVSKDNSLKQMSHDELYSLAQDYDVYGRTKMDDEELIESIKAAQVK